LLANTVMVGLLLDVSVFCPLPKPTQPRGYQHGGKTEHTEENDFSGVSAGHQLG